MDPAFYSKLHDVQTRHWWYAARRDLLAEIVRGLGPLPPGTIYDLGCGVGANLPVLQRFGPTIGVDGAKEAVTFCHERGFAEVHQADLGRLEGLVPGSASLVVLADVLEHLDDERPCLEAVHDLLAEGGALVVTVPAYMFLWGPGDVLVHHKRRYTERRLREVVAPVFDVEWTSYFNTFLFGATAVARFAERLLDRPGHEAAGVPPGPVNGALRAIFSAERHLLRRHVHLPFGVSILCIARRRAGNAARASGRQGQGPNRRLPHTP
ncbi:MAG TPA: class I SAM-dependent methyltransferase [Polyangiaceae bacterium]|jgi:SAM-dependent methyltransferase